MGTAGTARLALIAMAFALGAPALAGDSVVDLFREAERGRVAPIVEALESGQHNDDDQALLRARLVADRFDPAVLADAEFRRLAPAANDPDQRRIALAGSSRSRRRRASATALRATSRCGSRAPTG